MDDIRPRGSGPQRRPFTFDRPSGSDIRRPAPARPASAPQPAYSSPKPTSKSAPAKSRRTKRSKKPFFITLLILLLIGGGASAYWFVIKPRLNKPAPAISQTTTEETTPQPEKLTGNFRILATGDMITHDSVNQSAKQPDGSYKYDSMFTEIKPLLEKNPTRICHNTVPATGGAISGYPSFNAPSELISGLATNGCNILSLASDHINDKGQGAIDVTLAEAEKHTQFTLTAGANRSVEEQSKERTFNMGNGAIKFGYFSYTTRQTNSGSTPHGVNVYSKELARQQIGTVRDKVDFVIVSMCWGKEDSGDVAPEQETVAQELSDLGANIVFGHCPHVVQSVKSLTSSDGKYQTIVYYSLGNMLNSQLPIETLIGGMAVVDIDLETKKITSTGFLPTYMHYEWTAAQKQAKDLGSRKNLKLFPLDKAEAPLGASQNGTTVQAQTDRIKEILNRFTPVKIFTSAEI